MKKILIIMCILMSFFVVNSQSQAKFSANELRVRTPFRLPVDPLNIVSMSDYDLALLLCRNWFDFDDGRTAKPGLVSKWSFDASAGGYWFEIDSSAKWSDGSDISSQDLIFNLKRIVGSASSYGHTIGALVDAKSAKIDTAKRFFVRTVSGKPADSFFQRMGSIFLALVNPKDLTMDGKMRENKHSSGPYVLKKVSDEEVVLVKNEFWNGHSLKNSPSTITLKKPDSQASFSNFLDQKSWENITQVSSMMPFPEADKLKVKSLPMWTRDHDRVSLLRPAGGKALDVQKQLLIRLWKAKNKIFENTKLPLNSKVANSLQPYGYPLFNNLNMTDKDGVSKASMTQISIAAPDSMATRTQMELMNPLFKSVGVIANWKFLPKEKFIPLLDKPIDCDFLFFDFGVADPEPMTWVSLIVNMKFVYLDGADEANFKMISQSKLKEKDISSLKSFLAEIAAKGGYVPLFHFSTLSVAQAGISFKQIRDLDETVDYSKI